MDAKVGDLVELLLREQLGEPPQILAPVFEVRAG
jgi:hypothetical protein